MDVFAYKGFSGEVDFCVEDGIFTGRIAGIADVVGFHGEDEESIVAAFREAVDDYIIARQSLQAAITSTG